MRRAVNEARAFMREQPEVLAAEWEKVKERENVRKSEARQKREKIRRQKRRRSRRQKQRMLDEKHAHSEIKANRRKVEEP